MRLGFGTAFLLVAGVLAAGAVPARAADPVVAAAGDIACGPAETGVFPCQQQATSDLLFVIHPDAVVALGDNQYNSGALPDYEKFYDPTWGRMKAITHPAIGNHEYGTNGAGYWDYYNGAGQDNGPAGQRNQGWYSFDVGAWHLIALNGNCDRITGGCGNGSPQETWLEADLKAHPAACTLAFGHQPLWAGAAFATPAVQPLFQDLYDAQAEIFLVAHDHLYERFAPSTPSQKIDTANGVQQFIVGTGGRDLSGVGPLEPNAQVRDNKTFGVLKLTLHPNSYDWQFMPIGGQGFTDSGSRACHGPGAPPAQPPPPPPPPPPPAPPPLNPNPPAASPPEADEQSSRVTTRLTVASTTRGRVRVVIRGRLTTGASASRLRLTLSRRTRNHGTIRVFGRARGGRSGSWKAVMILPRAARGLRKFRLTIRYLGEPSYTPQSLQITIRPRRP